MKNMLNFLFPIMLLAQPFVTAQEIISSVGDHFTSGVGSLSWTLGEPATETFGNGTIFTQGFQQNYEEILSLQHLSQTAQFDIYPNPFQTSINIAGMDHTFSEAERKLRLFDNSGRMVYEGKVEPIIHLQHLLAGSYILNLEMNNGAPYVFRLIKSNASE